MSCLAACFLLHSEFMSLPFHRYSPSRERLVRTAFWTLCVVSLTAYALVVETFGLGLFLPDQHVPKLHMRTEPRVAFMLSLIAGVSMFGINSFVSAPSRRLGSAVLAALAFWLVYLAIPRF